MAAWGHAVLLETRPADGAVLAAPPDAVILRFNEPVAPVSMRLIAGSGREVAVERLRVTDGEVTLPFTGPLEHGQYLVSYQVTSLDSHRVRGSFTFSVGDDPTASVTPEAFEPPSQPWMERFAHLNRALYFITLLAAAGLALFRALFPLPASAVTARALPLAATAGIATALLNLGLNGVLLTGGGPEQLLAAGSWAAVGRLSA